MKLSEFCVGQSGTIFQSKKKKKMLHVFCPATELSHMWYISKKQNGKLQTQRASHYVKTLHLQRNKSLKLNTFLKKNITNLEGSTTIILINHTLYLGG